MVVQHPETTPNIKRRPDRSTAPQTQQQNLLLPPTGPPPAVEENVDTSGIWYRLRLHDLKVAEAKFNRLSQANLGWKPPADLILALTSAEFDPAKAQGDTRKMRRLAASIGALDRCAHPDLAWSMPEAPGTGERQTLLDMAQHCADPGIAAGSMNRFLRSVPPATRLATVTSLSQQE